MRVGDILSIPLQIGGKLPELRFELCPSGSGSSQCRRLTVRNSNIDGRLSFRTELGCEVGGRCVAMVQDFDANGKDFDVTWLSEMIVEWQGPSEFQAQATSELVVRVMSDREKIRLPIWPFTAGTLKIEALGAGPGVAKIYFSGPPIVASTSLLEGQMTAVRVHDYSEALHGLRLLLCDDASCSRLSLQPSDRETNGTSFSTWQGCNVQGHGCASGSHVKGEDLAWPALTARQLSFTVERRADSLVVRPEGAASDGPAATLPARPGAYTLRVRPETWGERWMLVQFQKVGVPRTALVVGDLKTVRVRMPRGAVGLRLVLCSSIGLCAALTLRGFKADGGLNYRAGARCTSEGDACQGNSPDFDVGTDFPAGWLELSVEWRGPALGIAEPTELLVWPKGRPEQKAKLPIWPWSVGELAVLVDRADLGDHIAVEFKDVAVPSVPMSPGDVTSINVGFLEAHKAVRFLLCNATECSRLSFGAKASSSDTRDTSTPFPDRTMHFLQKCNQQGHLCGVGQSSIFPEQEAHVRPVLAPGELVFTAVRRPQGVALRLRGGPAQEAVLDAPEGETVLRVRPDAWAEREMAVRFASGGSVDGERENVVQNYFVTVISRSQNLEVCEEIKIANYVKKNPVRKVVLVTIRDDDLRRTVPWA
ncbi:uncharacterized protein LOC117646582 [Thrips palmi]|uniref:Uncharacterized protein LOC117646582 n=1 Tax=Thrips palmi TaxID=161013 RepID=A0A6P8Z0N9_THRPL|nr:uncharacterized protein LOC117646582 [Thrips palmi]